MESIGGQAVIEGVMIRNKDIVATAVRKSSGKIKVSRLNVSSITKKHKILNLPVIRGVIILFETMMIGIKSLNFSANESTNTQEKEEMSQWQLVLAIIIALAFALVLFKLLPLGIVQLINNFFILNRFSFSIIEGVLKLLILSGYIYAISFMPDIKRIFMYHGAEHKVVNCYENEGKVTVKAAKKYSTIHKRCGTNFVTLVLIISVLVYIFIPLEFSFMAKYAARVALLPLVAGISYEVLKVNAKYPKLRIFELFIIPGLLLQRVTTKEPNSKQLEVALRALKESLKQGS